MKLTGTGRRKGGTSLRKRELFHVRYQPPAARRQFSLRKFAMGLTKVHLLGWRWTLFKIRCVHGEHAVSGCDFPSHGHLQASPCFASSCPLDSQRAKISSTCSGARR